MGTGSFGSESSDGSFTGSYTGTASEAGREADAEEALVGHRCESLEGFAPPAAAAGQQYTVCTPV